MVLQIALTYMVVINIFNKQDCLSYIKIFNIKGADITADEI